MTSARRILQTASKKFLALGTELGDANSRIVDNAMKTGRYQKLANALSRELDHHLSGLQTDLMASVNVISSAVQSGECRSPPLYLSSGGIPILNKEIRSHFSHALRQGKEKLSGGQKKKTLKTKDSKERRGKEKMRNVKIEVPEPQTSTPRRVSQPIQPIQIFESNHFFLFD